ncbi:ATP-binding protein [Burkholderia sp. SCN-KJ]|uniref:ATP-binding protein n=1 Tax=Burkholderia sp. SCN-KJ TaxID=2969248 RepID=UPI00214F9088|nr:ATP-binding protein [Burkholderia sp. SCN-KJ]MCR4470026.1 ATP-binding protein [Burkholderia sp. SCN-KJ]
MPLLIVADFVLKPLHSPWGAHFTDLVDARYEPTAAILTSNQHLGECTGAFLDNRDLRTLRIYAYPYRDSMIVGRLAVLVVTSLQPNHLGIPFFKRTVIGAAPGLAYRNRASESRSCRH